MVKIVFGTDGWRGILEKEFTLNNVRVVVAQVIPDYMWITVCRVEA
jgi:phosphomannomutase